MVDLFDNSVPEPFAVALIRGIAILVEHLNLRVRHSAKLYPVYRF